jgi:sec-independent protein translocase protein TatB
MQIFNIGPVELILILLIMFILLGPEGMLKTARQIGKWIRELIHSPIWRDIMGYSREIRDLPTKIVRESGLDEDLEEIRRSTQEVNDDINNSVKEANKEIEQSLKEAGSVDIRISPTPPPASRPTTAMGAATPTNGAASPAPTDPQEAPEDQIVPAAQTFDKYHQDDEEEDK